MPMYEYCCKGDHVSERVYRIDERRSIVQCDTCRKPAARIISAPVTHGFEEHTDENLVEAGGNGEFHVKSRAHKAQRLKDLGLVEREPSYESRARQRKDTIFSLPGEKR